MSGGSYDYLFSKDARDLVEHYADGDHGAMARMIARLRTLDGDDVADELVEAQLLIRAALRRVDVIVGRCAPTMKAVEWLDSCDWSEDAVAAALAEYRGLDQ